MSLREENLERLQNETFDVVILGGGINGAVSAACLSARGLRVALLDRGDFAGFTSQQSSNLAWGGIKYMESFEFGLVHKLCRSRNLLLRSYPSTVQEIRFYLAHQRGFRHGLWKLHMGAWFYWFLGGFFTRPPRRLSLQTMTSEEPIVNQEGCDGGLEYSDAYLKDNDARFVFSFVRKALQEGCAAVNYVASLGARRARGQWVTRARDERTGREFSVRSRLLVNACGPFVDEHNARTGVKTRHRHVFSKGIHLLVPRLTEHQRVLTFFADDGRLFFVIPMGPRTCIGTTDTRVEQPNTLVTPEDRRFVLENINKRLSLAKPLAEADIIAERCGVRPLVVLGGTSGRVDWLQLSRKHEVEASPDQGHISIFGGKLTDCLNVGEEVATLVQQLGVTLPRPGASWFGEPPAAVRRRFFLRAAAMGLDDLTAPSASEPLSTRLWRRYGEDAFAMLDAVEQDPAQARQVIEGAEYIRCELEHAARCEMITTLEDFLRRRSKVALVMRDDQILAAPGLLAACRILFGDQAQARLDEWRHERFPSPQRLAAE
jgi:glycerol-3-phosphate dehydrogenase